MPKLNDSRLAAGNDVTRRAFLAQAAATGVVASAPEVAGAETPRRKLLLGGGGIRGAFQAGAIRGLLRKGYEPIAVYGVSVGGLNAAFLADRAFFLKKPRREYYATLGRPIPSGPEADKIVDWPFIGDELAAFWKDNITSSRSLIRKRRSVAALSALFGAFNGLLDVSPMRDLVKAHLDVKRMRAGGISVEVSAVDIDTGVPTYITEDKDYFLEGIVASAAMPVLMPFVEIPIDGKKARFCDGGLREVLPTALGTKPVPGRVATHLVSIVCQPPWREYGPLADPGNLIHLVQRYADIAAEEIIKNDLDVLHKSGIKSIIIRPAKTVNIDKKTKKPFEIDAFTREQIAEMIDTGVWYANNALDNPANRFVADGFKST